MRLICHLQPWLSGSGPHLWVADVLPKTRPLCQWTETFPWAALVEAIEKSFTRRFPQRSPRHRRPVPMRVLPALESSKHEVGASDEGICERLRPDVAVLSACGIGKIRLHRPH